MMGRLLAGVKKDLPNVTENDEGKGLGKTFTGRMSSPNKPSTSLLKQFVEPARKSDPSPGEAWEADDAEDKKSEDEAKERKHSGRTQRPSFIGKLLVRAEEVAQREEEMAKPLGKNALAFANIAMKKQIGRQWKRISTDCCYPDCEFEKHDRFYDGVERRRCKKPGCGNRFHNICRARYQYRQSHNSVEEDICIMHFEKRMENVVLPPPPWEVKEEPPSEEEAAADDKEEESEERKKPGLPSRPDLNALFKRTIQASQANKLWHTGYEESVIISIKRGALQHNKKIKDCLQKLWLCAIDNLTSPWITETEYGVMHKTLWKCLKKDVDIESAETKKAVTDAWNEKRKFRDTMDQQTVSALLYGLAHIHAKSTDEVGYLTFFERLMKKCCWFPEAWSDNVPVTANRKPHWVPVEKVQYLYQEEEDALARQKQEAEEAELRAKEHEEMLAAQKREKRKSRKKSVVTRSSKKMVRTTKLMRAIKEELNTARKKSPMKVEHFAPNEDPTRAPEKDQSEDDVQPTKPKYPSTEELLRMHRAPSMKPTRASKGIRHSKQMSPPPHVPPTVAVSPTLHAAARASKRRWSSLQGSLQAQIQAISALTTKFKETKASLDADLSGASRKLGTRRSSVKRASVHPPKPEDASGDDGGIPEEEGEEEESEEEDEDEESPAEEARARPRSSILRRTVTGRVSIRMTPEAQQMWTAASPGFKGNQQKSSLLYSLLHEVDEAAAVGVIEPIDRLDENYLRMLLEAIDRQCTYAFGGPRLKNFPHVSEYKPMRCIDLYASPRGAAQDGPAYLRSRRSGNLVAQKKNAGRDAVVRVRAARDEARRAHMRALGRQQEARAEAAAAAAAADTTLPPVRAGSMTPPPAERRSQSPAAVGYQSDGEVAKRRGRGSSYQPPPGPAAYFQDTAMAYTGLPGSPGKKHHTPLVLARPPPLSMGERYSHLSSLPTAQKRAPGSRPTTPCTPPLPPSEVVTHAADPPASMPPAIPEFEAEVPPDADPALDLRPPRKKSLLKPESSEESSDDELVQALSAMAVDATVKYKDTLAALGIHIGRPHDDDGDDLVVPRLPLEGMATDEEVTERVWELIPWMRKFEMEDAPPLSPLASFTRGSPRRGSPAPPPAAAPESPVPAASPIVGDASALESQFLNRKHNRNVGSPRVTYGVTARKDISPRLREAAGGQHLPAPGEDGSFSPTSVRSDARLGVPPWRQDVYPGYGTVRVAPSTIPVMRLMTLDNAVSEPPQPQRTGSPRRTLSPARPGHELPALPLSPAKILKRPETSGKARPSSVATPWTPDQRGAKAAEPIPKPVDSLVDASDVEADPAASG